MARVHSAFQVCSFLLLCSLQSLTGRKLARGLASTQYHFAFHGQSLALSEVSPRLTMLSGAQQKRSPYRLVAEDLTGEEAMYSLMIPLCRPSTCLRRGSNPHRVAHGWRMMPVQYAGYTCYISTPQTCLLFPISVQCHGGVLPELICPNFRAGRKTGGFGTFGASHSSPRPMFRAPSSSRLPRKKKWGSNPRAGRLALSMMPLQYRLYSLV